MQNIPLHYVWVDRTNKGVVCGDEQTNRIKFSKNETNQLCRDRRDELEVVELLVEL